MCVLHAAGFVVRFGWLPRVLDRLVRGARPTCAACSVDLLVGTGWKAGPSSPV
jgi:hypothetical protein